MRGELSPAYPLRDVGGAPLDPPRTWAALSWDAGALRVSFDAASEPPLAVGGAAVYEDECVELFLCDAGEEARYSEVVVNPAGAVYTARIHNPDGSRATWRLEPGAALPGLAVEVSGEPAGAPELFRRWRCRITLPWRGTPPRPGEVRRGNLYRISRGSTTRFEALSPTLRSDPPDFHVPARFAGFVFE